MTGLLVYLGIALGFSFLCSIVEAVLLSVTTAYISLMVQQGNPSAKLLKSLKADIDRPLAAILTLNTIAHTAGAAGVGAQAAVVFGDNSLGIISAVLTLLILVFSEIIPKTLGTVYWRQLAPSVAYILRYMVLILAPFVWMAKILTERLKIHPTLRGFSREEFAAMAALGEREGQLNSREARILENVFRFSDMPVEVAMTPNIVIFSLPASSTVDAFIHRYQQNRFSRIPIYDDNRDHISGFVLRNDLLLAKTRDNGDNPLVNYRRELLVVSNKLPLLSALELSIGNRAHMLLVVNEYGDTKGLITLEDIIETLIGFEIVDEHDKVVDLQVVAKKLLQRKLAAGQVNSD